jgi:hypothetical protein
MTDDELRSMLRIWQAPPAPESLRSRVFRPRWSSLRWLLAGEIRVPVPVALLLLALLLFITWRELRPPDNSLSNFEQVHKLQPRIVRTIHETR